MYVPPSQYIKYRNLPIPQYLSLHSHHLSKLMVTKGNRNRLSPSIERQRPFLYPQWDLFSEKNMNSSESDRHIFWSHLNSAMGYIYDVCPLKKIFFKSRKSHFVIKLTKNHVVLCETAQ